MIFMEKNVHIGQEWISEIRLTFIFFLFIFFIFSV